MIGAGALFEEQAQLKNKKEMKNPLQSGQIEKTIARRSQEIK